MGQAVRRTCGLAATHVSEHEHQYGRQAADIARCIHSRPDRLRFTEAQARGARPRTLRVSAVQEASAYAELTCDRWHVLSAKHGLVHPDEVIEPHDMRLGIENLKVIALAGKQYRYAVYRGRWEYEAPMQGMGIGQQLGWPTARFSGDARQAG